MGCISFHSNQNFVIVAIETDSHKPAGGYPVRIVYPYDHYGVFYYLNAPKPVNLKLEANGSVETQIADFCKPHLVVGSTIFILDEIILDHGGKPHKVAYNKTYKSYQKSKEIYGIYQLPSKKYPEVDVEIIKN